MVRRILVIGLTFSLLAAVFSQGAFHSHQFLPIFGLCVVLGLAALVEHPKRDLTLIAVPLLLSTAIAAYSNDDFESAMPTFGGVTLFAAVVIVASRLDVKDLRRMLTDAALLTAASGWYGVTFRQPPWGRIAQELWRGSSSITYSNIAAVVIAVGLIVAIEQQRLKPTLNNALSLLVMLAGFASTQSRAGALALAIALIIFAISTRLVGWSNLVAPVIGGTVAGAAVVATSPEPNPDRPLLAIIGLVIAIAIVVGLHFRPKLRWAALLIVLLAGGAILAGPASDSRQQITGVRLDLQSEDRANEWDAASKLFDENRWLGAGPGDAALFWSKENRTFEAAFAHNEYLQLAAEQGLIGLAALLATVLLVIVVALRRPPPFVLAAIATVMIHASFDFLAHVPVTLMVLAIVIAIPVSTDLEPVAA